MSEKVWNILLAILVGAFLIVSGVLLWRLIRPSEPETTPPPPRPLAMPGSAFKAAAKSSSAPPPTIPHSNITTAIISSPASTLP